jgi:hypothetical protein
LNGYISFIFIFPDFKDFFGIDNYAPYLGHFYYSLFNGLIAGFIAGKIVGIWYSNPLKEY